MPLTLVTGPANAAKAGEVLGGLRARLEQDAVLVVPAFQDVGERPGAVDAVRREERLRKRTERASNLEPVTGEDPAEDVVEDAYLRVRRKEVRAALSTLPAEQRRVLDMAYFGGMTQARIAEELGIPLGTVKTRTLAAMRKLRAALQEG